jgi:hypothetical protein
VVNPSGLDLCARERHRRASQSAIEVKKRPKTGGQEGDTTALSTLYVFPLALPPLLPRQLPSQPPLPQTLNLTWTPSRTRTTLSGQLLLLENRAEI